MNIDHLEQDILFENLPAPGAKRVAVVIGRFNPPTRGHYAVIQKVRSFIKNNPELKLEINPVVVVIGGSKSDLDKKKNPLSVTERIVFMQSSGHADGVLFETATDAFKALASLRDKNMEPIAIAAGSDRIEDYIQILDKYFKTTDGKDIPHSKILLKRDEAATDSDLKDASMETTLEKMKSGSSVETDLVSGSLARRAVELGYEEEFAELVGLKKKPVLAKKMFQKISAAFKE